MDLIKEGNRNEWEYKKGRTKFLKVKRGKGLIKFGLNMVLTTGIGTRVTIKTEVQYMNIGIIRI